MSQPLDKFVDTLGLAIHYLEWGEPRGEPLILVHGFLDQAASWGPFVNFLQTKLGHAIWIVAPDCRGHGDSGWVGAGGYYHFPDYVFDLNCVIGALGAERIKLIGHSMGGSISLLYAGTFPHRVRKLVSIEGLGAVGMEFSDAPVRMEKWINEVAGRGRHHFREYNSIESGAKQLQQTNLRLDNQRALNLASTGMKQNIKGKWVWKYDPLHRTTSPQPSYSAQTIEFLRRIECPVLAIEGRHSQLAQRPDRQQQLAVLRNKNFAVIDDAGHMVHHDTPRSWLGS